MIVAKESNTPGPSPNAPGGHSGRGPVKLNGEGGAGKKRKKKGGCC